MTPNVHISCSMNHIHRDIENHESSTQSDEEKYDTGMPRHTHSCGAKIWHHIQAPRYQFPIVNKLTQNRDEKVFNAMEDIRVMNDKYTNQIWLNQFRGELHDIPKSLLDSVATRAPRHFAARVSDFNENLLFDMRTKRGLSDLGLDPIEKMLGARESLGSFMTTESTVPQPAHVDYAWEVLEKCGHELWIGFFPLTNDGMFLQVWPLAEESTRSVSGQLVFIPFGKLLVLPSRTIHGGGFRTTMGGSHGNLRFHIYFARGPGSKLPTHQANKYTEKKQKSKELCDRYVDCPSMQTLREYLFV